VCGRLTVARGERIILGKRLVLEFTDRENHFLSRFETVTVLNVGRNEGNLGTVRAINNSKSLRRGDGRTTQLVWGCVTSSQMQGGKMKNRFMPGG